MAAAATVFEDPTPVGVLDALRAAKRAEMAAVVDQLCRVVEWCAAHEVPAEDEAATVVEMGRDTGLLLAGDGAPLVSEFAVLELATALGMTSEAGRRYVGKVLELPGFWEQVIDLNLEWWRAARVAEYTINLPEEGAEYVDDRLSKLPGKLTFGQVERLAQEALELFDPEAAEAKRRQALERRRVDVHLDDVGSDGVVEITGAVELADGLDLDNALTNGAAELKALGNTESLDVRRSLALGGLARRQLTLDLNADQPDNPGGPDGKGAPLVKPRQTVVHAHTFGDRARCSTTRSPVTVDQVRSWCAHPDTQVIIREVIDLDEHIHVDRYERDDRLDTQTIERDVSCVFPYCTKPAAGCDCDHVVPFARGGPTCSCNLAPACRGHHRAKTHGGWTATVLSAGHYLWRSPSGLWFYRDHHGTRDLGHLTPD